MKAFITLLCVLLFGWTSTISPVFGGSKPATSAIVIIKVHYPETTPQDSFILYQSTGGVLTGSAFKEKAKLTVAKRRDGGWYEFRLAIQNPKRTQGDYIRIDKLSNAGEREQRSGVSGFVEIYTLLKYYPIKEGDRVDIEVERLQKNCSAAELRELCFPLSRQWISKVHHPVPAGFAKLSY